MNGYPGILYVHVCIWVPFEDCKTAVAKIAKGGCCCTRKHSRVEVQGLVSTLTFSSTEFAFRLLAKFSRHTKSIDPALLSSITTLLICLV